MTEEFALEQTLGHCAAIQLDEGAVLSLAVVVNCTGYKFLARAAFSGDKHSRIGRRDELNLLLHLLQAGTVADDVAKVLSAADFFPQVGVLLLEAFLLLLDQHAIRNFDKHRARVIASRSPPGPTLDPHCLAIVLTAQFEHEPTGIGAVSDRVKRFAQAALGVGGIRHKRLPECPAYLFGL